MSNTLDNNSSSMENLDKWNQYYTERFFTSTVLVSVLLAIGIPGNLLVVIVYHFRLRKFGSGRYFIKYLAVCDIIGLIVSGSLNLLRNLHHVTFPGNVTCKIMLFLSYSITCESLTILVVIAIQRFFIICFHPPKEMSLALRRFALAFSVFFSLSSSSPILHFYGGVPMQNKELNVTGLTCALLGTIDIRKFYIYQYVSVLFNISGVALLTMSYATIGVKVIRKRRSVRDIRNREHAKNVETNNRTSRFHNGGQENASEETGGKSQRSKRKKMAKLSKIFRTISIIAFLSYVPIWVFIFIESSNTSFWDELTVPFLQICLLLRTSYLLIHTTNPFIYAYLDRQFRHELTCLFRVGAKSKEKDSNESNSS